MILIDKIKIEAFGNRRLKYYSDLGYDISGEYFEIRIEDLNIGSRKIVPVKCDYCNKDVNITYREYKRNILLGNKYAWWNVEVKSKVIRNIFFYHSTNIQYVEKFEAAGGTAILYKNSDQATAELSRIIGSAPVVEKDT